MADKLAEELIAASKNEGNAIKKKQDKPISPRRASRITIQGTPDDQVAQTLDATHKSVQFIKILLNYFRLVKLREIGSNQEGQLDLINNEMMSSEYSLPTLLSNGKINEEELSKMFEWSLMVFIQNEKETTPFVPDIDPEEIPGLKEDLIYMAGKVNDYLH